MSEEVTKMAEEIFQLVGPKENILSVKNCVTSLKLKLKDKKKVDVGVLRRVEGVSGIIETQDQLEVVILHRNSKDVVAEFIKVSGMKDKLSQAGNEIKQKNSEPFKLLLKKVSSIFIK